MSKPVAVLANSIEPSPDAELIAVCGDFAAAYTEREELHRRHTDETGNDLPEELEAPFNTRIDAAFDKMIEIKAVSLAGVMARANALFVYDPSIVDPDSEGARAREKQRK